MARRSSSSGSDDRSHEYVLGTGDSEFQRLGLQHRLWSAQAFACWERAGVRPGSVVLDVGCGPGFATLDLAQLVAPTGRVIAIDESERFASILKARAREAGASNVEVFVQDVQAMEVAPESIDVAYARWVLCFVTRPDDVVATVARALRPGGVFVVQDYLDWTTLAVTPHAETFAKVAQATMKNWRAHGGDMAIGKRLPAIMAKHGFRVETMLPLQRIARSGDPLWMWPETFFANFSQTLVERGMLAPADRAAFLRDWARLSKDETAFFWTPPMIEILARRA
jgi:SAM-dependent methyltransferase